MKPIDLKDPIQLLRKLVSLNSVNPFQTTLVDGQELGVGNEQQIQVFLESTLKDLGFRVERQYLKHLEVARRDSQNRILPERFNVVAEKGQGSKSLLFFAHVDTVDVKEGWKTDPFQLTEDEREGNVIYRALGANDMKGGIAAFLSAFAEIPSIDSDWKIKVALLADEEFWSFGAVRLLESDFLKDVHLAVVPEISEVQVGWDEQWVGLGRLGRSEFRFDVSGYACHGADAFVCLDAVNAVHEAAKLEVAIIEYCESVRNAFQAEGISVMNSAYINRHEGGKGILSVPDSASFVLDRTLVPGETEASELERLQGVIRAAQESGRVDRRCRIEISTRKRPTPPCQPYFLSPSSPGAQFVIQQVREICPKVVFGIGRSVADENRFAEIGIPTLILAPIGEGSHTCNEWVGRESILRLKAMFQQIVSQLSHFRSQKQ